MIMSTLRPAQLGPLVGHTTDTSATIWIRGFAQDNGTNIDNSRRAIGTIAISHINGKAIKPNNRRVYYFRLKREYDRTGVFMLGRDGGIKFDQKEIPPLSPDTEYTVRVGTLVIDDPMPESLTHSDYLAARLPTADVWFDDLCALPRETSEAIFKTFPAENSHNGDMAFILGSCRYPGILWKEKHADEIFGPLLAEAQGNGPVEDGHVPRPAVNMQLMVGDQIYADMLNRHIPIGLADTFEEFQERYHKAFGSPNMRTLLRQVPTYMILDDHEIEDNWSQDRIKNIQSRRVFNLAIDAYRSYQWVHCPRNFGERLFYEFSCSGFPFFVLDTRTQRYMDDEPDTLIDNHMLGRPSLHTEEPNQLDFLLNWLQESQSRYQDCPKFIVSSSVFAPNPMDARSSRGDPNDKDIEKKRARWCAGTDSWPAFPNTRKAILAHIVTHQIQNVVFLSGDIHCSNVAQLSFSGSKQAQQLKAFSIVSSALYWPFPFADGEPSSFVHDSRDARQGDTFEFSVGKPKKKFKMDYTAWNFTQEDNYCRVDINRNSAQIKVTAFDGNGDVIETGGWFGQRKIRMESTLQLAPW